MSLDDYYRRLELPGTASPAEVKRAYRRLRAKYHPDRNKGREAAVEPVFKRIQEAFEILIGERKAPIPARPTPASARAPEPASAPTWKGEWAWGATQTQEREPPPRSDKSGPPVRGANCTAELFVPLEAAIYGGDVEVRYGVKGPCTDCHGHPRARCPTCFGKGVVAYRKCETVNIAPGAWDGQRVIVAGAGHPGINGGASGDALFSVVIVCNSIFRREGLNIACDIEVDFMTAMLGGSVEARVLGRALAVTIQPNSGASTTIRLRAQGLSDRHGARGDLMLHLILALPAAATYLTEAERDRLREIFEAAQRRATANPSTGNA